MKSGIRQRTVAAANANLSAISAGLHFVRCSDHDIGEGVGSAQSRLPRAVSSCEIDSDGKQDDVADDHLLHEIRPSD